MITLTPPSSEDRPLRMPWKQGITVGRAYELLRSDLIEHLRVVQRAVGYRYCRFHGVFHDDMDVVRRDADGRLFFQWHQVDKAYDALLAIGLKPFVELNPMPAALASGTQTIFAWKMNVTPPIDYDEWAQLVRAFAEHLIERYGHAEVATWYFEVWNEPNLSGFWSGTQEDYWRLYDVSARALKAVSPALRVGGPATSKASWIAEFIEHCAQENVPVDFVSTHVYPQDEYVSYQDRAGSPHKLGEFFTDMVRGVRETVRASARPGLEIHWTEWNTLSTDATANIKWVNNPFIDGLFSAALVARHMVALDDAAESLMYWTASDVFEESGMPGRPFSGGYGLLTIHGIPKAAFHAFALLNRLRGRRLAVRVGGDVPGGAGLCATHEGGTMHVLLWNWQKLEVAEQPVWSDTLELPASMPCGQVLATRIRLGAGSAYESWLALGRPANLTRGQEAFLRAQAEPERALCATVLDNGQSRLDIRLAANEVLHLEITAAPVPAVTGRIEPGSPVASWDQAMGEKSK